MYMCSGHGSVPGRIGGAVDINTVPLAIYNRCALFSSSSSSSTLDIQYKDRIMYTVEQKTRIYGVLSTLFNPGLLPR